MIHVRFFAWRKSPNLSVVLFVIVCFVSPDFWLSDLKSRAAASLDCDWLHTPKSQDQVQKEAALVVRAEEQQWFSEDTISPFFFLFCSSQIYTVLHLFLYVHVAERLWYQGCARTALPMPLLSFHAWEFELRHPDCSVGIRVFGLQKEIN